MQDTKENIVEEKAEYREYLFNIKGQNDIVTYGMNWSDFSSVLRMVIHLRY